MANTTTSSATLLVKLHGQGSRTLDLSKDQFTIGRKSDNDLVIEDQSVSGHHAKIVKVQAVYFIEDLRSTNGTMVNGKPIERQQLRDADGISIGQHRLIFQDASVTAMAPAAPAADLDQTMVLSGKGASTPQPTATASLLVTTGKTDRLEYQLTKPVSLIGSQDGAAIQLAGWFAPKAAAQITSRGGAYFIGPMPGAKPVVVNGATVTGQQQLKNGDEIAVAGVEMTFYLKAPKK